MNQNRLNAYSNDSNASYIDRDIVDETTEEIIDIFLHE